MDSEVGYVLRVELHPAKTIRYLACATLNESKRGKGDGTSGNILRTQN